MKSNVSVDVTFAIVAFQQLVPPMDAPLAVNLKSLSSSKPEGRTLRIEWYLLNQG